MMIPNINFRDHLAELTDQMDEIKQDLPELRYYDIKEPSGISTETMRMMLGGAVDRVIDARGSAHSALVRANQMALTLARVNNIEGFADIGTYEAGQFEHDFADQEVLPLTKKERADIVKVYQEADMDIIFSMQQAGYTNEEVEQYKRSPEYLTRMQTKANDSGIPLETLLKRAGWIDAELKEYGQQKLAAIALEQEDTVPIVEQ
jgi:predicted transglutaminase-like cysteine proteinase